MWIGRPLSIFALGGKHVITCEILYGHPFDVIDKDVHLYVEGDSSRKIILKGVSTASDSEHDIYDYSFEGTDISSCELTKTSILSDVSHEKALEHLMKISRLKPSE